MSRLSALLSLSMGNLLITCLLCTASLVFSYHTWCPIILINPSPTLCLLCLSMTDGHSLFIFFCVCSSSACVRSSAPPILLGLCILTWFFSMHGWSFCMLCLFCTFCFTWCMFCFCHIHLYCLSFVQGVLCVPSVYVPGLIVFSFAQTSSYCVGLLRNKRTVKKCLSPSVFENKETINKSLMEFLHAHIIVHITDIYANAILLDLK